MPKPLGLRCIANLILAFAIGSLFSFPTCAAASDAKKIPAPAGKILNQKRIHQLYADGDFDGVVAAIDSFTLADKTYSLSDSVFIFKHLAVIYTANPATRENGKRYMFQLLSVMPSAKLVDMFVSDEIDRIFEKVREEYVVRQQSLGLDVPTHLESNRNAADRMTMKEGSSEQPPYADGEKDKPKKVKPHTLYWVAGGVIFITAAGAAAYFLYPKKSADKTYDLP